MTSDDERPIRYPGTTSSGSWPSSSRSLRRVRDRCRASNPSHPSRSATARSSASTWREIGRRHEGARRFLQRRRYRRRFSSPAPISTRLPWPSAAMATAAARSRPSPPARASRAARSPALGRSDCASARRASCSSPPATAMAAPLTSIPIPIPTRSTARTQPAGRARRHHLALKACSTGQLLKLAGAGAYNRAKATTTPTPPADAARGIELDGTSFALKACPAGQLLKSAGAEAYTCAADNDTNTTYSAGTGLQLSGTQFSIANGGVSVHPGRRRVTVGGRPRLRASGRLLQRVARSRPLRRRGTVADGAVRARPRGRLHRDELQSGDAAELGAVRQGRAR